MHGFFLFRWKATVRNLGIFSFLIQSIISSWYPPRISRYNVCERFQLIQFTVSAIKSNYCQQAVRAKPVRRHFSRIHCQAMIFHLQARMYNFWITTNKNWERESGEKYRIARMISRDRKKKGIERSRYRGERKKVRTDGNVLDVCSRFNASLINLQFSSWTITVYSVPSDSMLERNVTVAFYFLLSFFDRSRLYNRYIYTYYIYAGAIFYYDKLLVIHMRFILL